MIEGVKPYPEYKDSGARWLGAVPSHWEVLPLRGVLAERKEKNDPIKTRNILSLSLQTGVIPYADKKPGGNKAKEDLSAYMLAYPGDIVLNSMNVVVGSVGLSKYFGAVSPVYYMLHPRRVDHGRIVENNLVRVDPADVPKTRNAFLTEGEIIVVRSGALTADSAIIPKKYAGAVAGYDMVVTVRKARPDFVAMALLSSYVHSDQLVIASMRAAQPHLNAEELGTAIILVPPDDEQKRIVKNIEDKNAPLDDAIARTEREIGLISEYRTRLVADVVTGKLDVRGAVCRLSAEAELSPISAEDSTSEAEFGSLASRD